MISFIFVDAGPIRDTLCAPIEEAPLKTESITEEHDQLMIRKAYDPVNIERKSDERSLSTSHPGVQYNLFRLKSLHMAEKPGDVVLLEGIMAENQVERLVF